MRISLWMGNDSKCASEGMSEASVSDEEPDKPATAKESLANLEVLKPFFNNLGNGDDLLTCEEMELRIEQLQKTIQSSPSWRTSGSSRNCYC